MANVVRGGCYGGDLVAKYSKNPRGQPCMVERERGGLCA